MNGRKPCVWRPTKTLAHAFTLQSIRQDNSILQTAHPQPVPFGRVSHAAFCSREQAEHKVIAHPPCLALSTNFLFPPLFTPVPCSASAPEQASSHSTDARALIFQ